MAANDKRNYKVFVHKEAVFRISCPLYEVVTAEIIRQRRILENYILKHPDFQQSLIPVEVSPNAPKIALQMADAAKRVGVGPMAAVAGSMAQFAAQAALKAGADEAIVDNGGDIFLKLATPAVIGIYSGPNKKLNQLAFSLQPEDTPLSICSSSGKMGHSMSLGKCDLAVTASKDAALADASATLAANLVKKTEDVQTALDSIMQIDGIAGVLIIQNGKVGLAGKLPQLIKTGPFDAPFYA